MGYIFLLIALFAGVTKGYCGKKTSGYTKSLSDALLANSIRMVLCIAIGFVVVWASDGLHAMVPNGKMLLIAALSGVFTAIFVVSWLVIVRKSAYMMLEIFLMLGVLIPLIASRIFFDETIRLNQWLGIAVLFAAVIIMCSYNNSVKAKLTPAALALLLLCGTSYGISDFSQKLFVKSFPDGSAATFNFYTYVFATVVLWGAYLVTREKDARKGKADVKKIFIYICIMSACLFANSFFKTLAAGHLNAVLLYPLNQGGSLILSSFMSAALFKEKLTAKAIIGISIAFAGLLIINLL